MSHPTTHRSKLIAVALAASMLIAACGKDSKKDSATTTSMTAAAGASSTSSLKATKADGNITVFAAASLTEAFTSLGKQFEAANPGSKVTFNFDASSALADSIDNQGAPADVFASADQKNMQKTTDAGKVETPTTFAKNKLEILVGKGNPKGITGVADFDKPGVAYVLCAAEVPCGKYGAQIVGKVGVKAKPKSYEENVKAVVSRVSLGEADAGIVYQSDVVAAGTKATGVVIPDSQNVIATYPIGVVKASKEQATAAAFIAFVESAAGQKVLTGDGFLPSS